jgi:hypothetical protein
VIREGRVNPSRAIFVMRVFLGIGSVVLEKTPAFCDISNRARMKESIRPQPHGEERHDENRNPDRFS